MKTNGRQRTNKVHQGLRHLWQLLLDGRVAGGVIEVSPDPSTNILRNVTNPIERQDAATRGWALDTFASVNYTATNATSGNRAVTLPNIADAELGALYVYRKDDFSANTVTLSGDVNIDGRASVVLYNQDETYVLKSDGAQWVVLSHYKNEDFFIADANFTLTYDSPRYIDLSIANIDLTVGSAGSFPIGKKFTIRTRDSWELYISESEYNQINFTNSDLATEEANLWELGPDDYVTIMSNGANWVISDRSDKRLQRTITASTYTAKTYDDIIIVDASSNDVTINLPAVGGTFFYENNNFYVKRIDSSVNTVTLDGAGSDTIDGNLTVGLLQWDSMEIYATKDEYLII